MTNPIANEISANVLKSSVLTLIIPKASRPPIIRKPKNAHAPKPIASAGPKTSPITTRIAIPMYFRYLMSK